MKTNGVILKKGKEAIFKQGHQWIFSGAIESFPSSFKDGAIYPVLSAQKEQLGSAYFHRSMSLSGRIVAWGSKDPLQAIFDHLDRAIQWRDELFAREETNTFRLINGEGDFLPGLVIDQYDDTLVFSSSTLGMDQLKEPIIEFLKKKERWTSIVEKSESTSRKEERLSMNIQVLWGQDPGVLRVRENGITFLVDWKEGQKTGLFLDQREMRKKVRELAYKKRVLNMFSYTGGFSLYALKGQASHVTSVDISKKALEKGALQVAENGFDAQKCSWIEEDAFQFLTKDPLPYDLVILDPPAFIKKRETIKAGIRGYHEINTQAIKKMPRGSLLLTCSCSYYMDDLQFYEMLFHAARMAKREVQVVLRHITASDHPVSLFHRESHYLKSALLYIY